MKINYFSDFFTIKKFETFLNKKTNFENLKTWAELTNILKY